MASSSDQSGGLPSPSDSTVNASPGPDVEQEQNEEEAEQEQSQEEAQSEQEHNQEEEEEHNQEGKEEHFGGEEELHGLEEEGDPSFHDVPEDQPQEPGAALVSDDGAWTDEYFLYDDYEQETIDLLKKDAQELVQLAWDEVRNNQSLTNSEFVDAIQQDIVSKIKHSSSTSLDMRERYDELVYKYSEDNCSRMIPEIQKEMVDKEIKFIRETHEYVLYDDYEQETIDLLKKDAQELVLLAWDEVRNNQTLTTSEFIDAIQQDIVSQIKHSSSTTRHMRERYHELVYKYSEDNCVRLIPEIQKEMVDKHIESILESEIVFLVGQCREEEEQQKQPEGNFSF